MFAIFTVFASDFSVFFLLSPGSLLRNQILAMDLSKMLLAIGINRCQRSPERSVPIETGFGPERLRPT